MILSAVSTNSETNTERRSFLKERQESENNDFFNRGFKYNFLNFNNRNLFLDSVLTGPIFWNIPPTFLKGDNSMLMSFGNFDASPSMQQNSFKPSIDSLNSAPQISNKLDVPFLKNVTNNLEILLSLVKTLSIEKEMAQSPLKK